MNPEWVKCLEKYPSSVTIPVNKKRVAGLYFLHTGGWSIGPMGQRRIEYDDGTKDIIQLGPDNMGDWNPGRENFPDEEVTTTTVAWRGANPNYPIIRVYQTLWVNPHPEKTIKQVVITNEELPLTQCKFIPHLGLTAVILPQGAPATAPRDAQKSQKLFHEAQALLDKKDAKAAAARLLAAVDADDSNTAAWTALTSLRADG